MTPRLLLAALFLLLCARHAAFADDPHRPVRRSTRSHLQKHPLHSKVQRIIDLPKRGYHEGITVGQYEIILNNGDGKDTYVIDIASGAVTSKIKPVATFSEGITGDSSGNYWVTDWDTKKLYKVRIEKGKMIPEKEISLKPSHPTGVAWNGSYLYVITWTRGMGTKYHLIKLDRDFNILKTFSLKGIPEPSQIAWDGKNFWVSSWFDRKVYRLEPVNFEITGFFKSPVKKTTGVAWDGKYFWVTGTDADLYQLEVQE